MSERYEFDEISDGVNRHTNITINHYHMGSNSLNNPNVNNMLNMMLMSKMLGFYQNASIECKKEKGALISSDSDNLEVEYEVLDDDYEIKNKYITENRRFEVIEVEAIDYFNMCDGILYRLNKMIENCVNERTNPDMELLIILKNRTIFKNCEKTNIFILTNSKRIKGIFSKIKNKNDTMVVKNMNILNNILDITILDKPTYFVIYGEDNNVRRDNIYITYNKPIPQNIKDKEKMENDEKEKIRIKKLI